MIRDQVDCHNFQIVDVFLCCDSIRILNLNATSTMSTVPQSLILRTVSEKKVHDFL